MYSVIHVMFVMCYVLCYVICDVCAGCDILREGRGDNSTC